MEQLSKDFHSFLVCYRSLSRVISPLLACPVAVHAGGSPKTGVSSHQRTRALLPRGGTGCRAPRGVTRRCSCLSCSAWRLPSCSGMIGTRGSAPWSSQTHGGALVTFNDILSQTLAMLQQHGRVSYRALKRQFALDDDYLADLTEALLFAHPQVVDEEGRGLVWTDIAGSTSATAVPYPSTPRVAQEPHAGERDVPSAVPPPPDAERRQLTVLFCD